MGLYSIAVQSACIELHFLRQGIRYYPIGVSVVIRPPLPVIGKTGQQYELIGFPLPKAKRAAADWVPVEFAFPHRHGVRIQTTPFCFCCEGRSIQEVLRQHAYHPGFQGWGVESFVYDPYC